jgi:hypothetical protein
MYKVMTSQAYWKTYVERSEHGIMNTIMSRLGLAGLYGFMRMGMMLGTCVNIRDNTLVIDTVDPSAMPLPLLNVPMEAIKIPCSSAIPKLTKIVRPHLNRHCHPCLSVGQRERIWRECSPGFCWAR